MLFVVLRAWRGGATVLKIYMVLEVMPSLARAGLGLRKEDCLQAFLRTCGDRSRLHAASRGNGRSDPALPIRAE